MRRRLPILILAAMATYVGVSCSKDDGEEIIEFEPELTASLNTIALAKEAGSADTFQITSNTDWTVVSSESWLAVSPNSGTEDAEAIVTAEENAGKDERNATLTVSAEGLSPVTIDVTQMGVGPTVVVAPKSINVGPEPDESNTFEVTSNTSWTITDFPDWLTVSPTTGTGNETITVTTTEIMTVSTARTAAVKVVTDEGEVSQTVNVSQTGFPCAESDETPCEMAGCTIPEMPTYASLPENAKLPDPFTFMSGSRMSSKDEWECRRAEIATLAQEFQLGYKPCTPYEATTASFEGNTLTITVTENGKTISFDCSITYPSTGSAPYPAMIGIGLSFLDNTLLSELGVAVINFPNNDIALQQDAGSRGRGKFYDLYCSDHSAGALMAWAWGVSRLVDALEKTPDTNIDPDRLGVTGCSRNGKGALVAGAFDERIALTIPQESGAGGAASWRVSDYQGSSVQRLRQIVGENCWLKADFGQFGMSVNKLPFDQHMVLALCAPRALLVIENTNMEWLGNLSTWTAGNAAHTVWEALEIPDKMGFSQYGHGNHCSYPENQKPELQAYVEKFLVGTGTADTEIMQTDGDLVYDEEMWVDWTVPDLD